MNGGLIQQVGLREAKVMVGGLSILTGILLLVGQIIHQLWIVFLAIILVGMITLLWSWKRKREIFITVGCLIIGVGAGLFPGFGLNIVGEGVARSGVLLLGAGCGFLLVTVIRLARVRAFCWWPTLPASILVSTGLCMLFSRVRLLDFVLYLSVGIGTILLGIGVIKRWLGFVIPGSIVLGSGLGVYLAWGTRLAPNALAQTGLMLVCFAFGWIAISMFSRKMTDQFVWWPLIPGGILAMVGWGLYIGGNPGEAASFIGNTGSVGLIVLGMYLLLLRRGIKK